MQDEKGQSVPESEEERDIRLDLDKPEESLTEESVLPVAPVKEGFNCEDCNGEGLLANGNIDPKCGGTGKV